MNRDILIAYLKNDFTEMDKAEVEKWIRENMAEFNRLKYVWEKTGVNTNEEHDMEKAWMRINPENRHAAIDGKRKIKILSTRFRRIAAIFILAIAVASLLYYQHITLNKVKLSLIEAKSSSEQIRQVQLTDGTVIWLNTGSKINYPEKFKQKTREVYLEGEAFFEVKPNKRKPFVVHTGNSITEVLGTSFNIKQEESGNVQVTVVTGTVALSDKTNDIEKVILKKDELGVFSEQNHSVLKRLNENLNFIAWKTGKLTFSKSPLTEVCEALTKYYKTVVKISDDTLQQINLTATYSHKTLEEVLEIMQLTLDIQYQNNDSCIVLFVRKQSDY